MTLENRKRYLDIHPEEAVYDGGDSVLVSCWKAKPMERLHELREDKEFNKNLAEGLIKIYIKQKMKELGYNYNFGQ